MIVVFDVGNSETTVGLFDGPTLRARWRLTTGAPRTGDELRAVLAALLDGEGVRTTAVTGSAIASVVPTATLLLIDACERLFGGRPTVVDGHSPLPLRLAVDEPAALGADRIVNALAAHRRWHRDAIVIDLGTATTYDCVTADGAFLGGVIQPGVRSAAQTLFRGTAQLAATELLPPNRVIATRTDECIRAGVLFGAADAVEGIVRRIRAEWPTPAVPIVVATGGLAALLAPHCPSVEWVEPNLTLEGVRLAHELLRAVEPG